MCVQNYNEEARKLLSEWKKERYAFGVNCAKKVGDFAKKEGKSCILIVSRPDQAPVSLITKDKEGKVNKEKTEDNIDTYMGALIDAIKSGDFSKIKIFKH